MNAVSDALCGFFLDFAPFLSNFVLAYIPKLLHPGGLPVVCQSLKGYDKEMGNFPHLSSPFPFL